MTDRAANLTAARAYLHEARNRRHAHASRAFYWTLLRWAADSRQRAAQGGTAKAVARPDPLRKQPRQLALLGAP